MITLYRKTVELRLCFNGGAINFQLGAIAKGFGEGNFPAGSTGEDPVEVRCRSPPEAEAVCRHCLHILTAETIKM